MTERTQTFSKTIGGDLFEIFRINFECIRAVKGFQRMTRSTRHQYKINGMVIPKADWFNLKTAAKQ